MKIGYNKALTSNTIKSYGLYISYRPCSFRRIFRNERMESLATRGRYGSICGIEKSRFAKSYGHAKWHYGSSWWLGNCYGNFRQRFCDSHCFISHSGNIHNAQLLDTNGAERKDGGTCGVYEKHRSHRRCSRLSFCADAVDAYSLIYN